MFGRNITHCLDCGKRFNIKQGAYLVSKPDGYVCPMCHEKREIAARKKETGMTQSDKQMNAKIVVGLILILIGIVWESDEYRWNLWYYIVCAIIGCSLIAWAVVPYFQGKKQMEEERLQMLLSKPLDSFGDMEIRKLESKYQDERDSTDMMEKPGQRSKG